MRDVVYLKNGSVIKGVIVEQVPGSSVTIETSDGSTFVYPIEDVSKITKEKAERANLYEKKKRFNFCSLNAGLSTDFEGVGLSFNLADLNVAAQNGWGGALKWGVNSFVEDGYYVASLGYLLGGPSYSIAFKEGTSVGTVKLLLGLASATATDGYEIATSPLYLAFDIGGTYRFFTHKRWNLLLNTDLLFVEEYVGFSVGLGFAYSW